MFNIRKELQGLHQQGRESSFFALRNLQWKQKNKSSWYQKDEIYDVLNSKYGSNGLCEIWYNIETRFDVNGWICGKFNNKDYVEVLEKE